MDGRDEPPANATAWAENDQRKALLMKALLAVTCGKAGAGGCERSQPIALRAARPLHAGRSLREVS
jgi:hypothetical protein